MIRLVFSANRELIHFLVIDKSIYYTDRKWATWIRCLPKPDNFIQKIRLSRNAFPAFLATLFNFTDEETAEYNATKTERDLADIITRDAKKKGCRVMIDREGDLKDEAVKQQILQSEFVADISQAPKQEEAPVKEIQEAPQENIEQMKEETKIEQAEASKELNGNN